MRSTSLTRGNVAFVWCCVIMGRLHDDPKKHVKTNVIRVRFRYVDISRYSMRISRPEKTVLKNMVIVTALAFRRK